MAETQTVQWRRDASTSRSVRLLWALGVGTFFGTIAIIVFWRLFDLTGQTGGQSLVVAVAAALVVTIVALAVSADPAATLERLFGPLPVSPPEGQALERALDAALGTVVMAGVLGGLIVVARLAAQTGFLGTGAGPFTFLAALALPLALVALVLSTFLSSVGSIDTDEQVLYLFDPEEAISLEYVDAVTVRQFGNTTLVGLTYAEPDGQYVPGPRRLVVPPEIAAELQTLVERTDSS